MLGKRPLPVMPRGIGIVTSLGAAALHDVVSVLRRRVPHIPVLLSPASVQGAAAPQELIRSLSNLYAMTQVATPFGLDQDNKAGPDQPDVAIVIDVILLVRGGGSIEDLWAFNDEQLARAIARSPVPVVCGIGHETDFTIADFVADLRAPTPTAAAELVAQPRADWLVAMNELARRGHDALVWYMDQQSQELDFVASRLGRPTAVLGQQRFRLASAAQRLEFASLRFAERARREMQNLYTGLPDALGRGLNRKKVDLERAELRLGLLDPSLVLRRGYAWLTSVDGRTISSVHQIQSGQTLHATLADGEVDLNTPASS
jgi:exodeoxyribonuclease VII large subunit